MERHDLEAMRRAIATLRTDPELGDTVEALLRDQGEQAAGTFAVGVLQVRSLRLKAWQCPPCDSTNKHPSNHYGCRPNEVALLRRMLALGISRFEPDPIAALAAAEANKPAA
jgi:hypothetical protein